MTTTTITEYDPIAAGLGQLRDRYLETTYEVTTSDGMKLAIAARGELRTLRLEVEDVRVEIKAPALAALKRCRVSDAEAKRITAEIVALEEPISVQIHAEQRRKHEAKTARERKETERLATIERDRLAAEQAEIERERAELAAAKAEQVRAAREHESKMMAERERIQAELREQTRVAKAARDKADAEAAAERRRLADVEAKRQSAERARIATEEAVVRAERERQEQERAERERQEWDRLAAIGKAQGEAAAEAEAAEVEHATLLEAARDVVARFSDWGVADELPARKLAAAVARAEQPADEPAAAYADNEHADAMNGRR